MTSAPPSALLGVDSVVAVVMPMPAPAFPTCPQPALSPAFLRFCSWRSLWMKASSSAPDGKAMGLYTLGPKLGPVIGPMRLYLRCERLIKETGNDKLHTDEKVENLPAKIGYAIIRPVRMLTTQPVVFCISIYMAYLFGVTYLIFATFPNGIGGLNYLSIAIGSFVGLLLNLKAIDVGQPEYRLPCMMVGSVITTVGLFWYGWSIGRNHWIMPNIVALIYTAGNISCL
ncbi:hypothetical protein VM1G_11851 [Cytospora mali]|uniref:Uncharacterized protein n=1 Tax=Cytospora mali TaxID=578113 RepID=A0A194W8D4_CYTMA|nr:hypothetical protein VM1G_11851 [Valsa mali]